MSGHADAHVEDLIEFRLGHAALGRDDLEDRQDVPGAVVDEGVAIFGQDARDVVHESRRR